MFFLISHLIPMFPLRGVVIRPTPSSQLLYNWLWMLCQLHKTHVVVQPSRKYGFGIKRFITGFLNERRGRIWEISAAVILLEDIWRGSQAKNPIGCVFVKRD